MDRKEKAAKYAEKGGFAHGRGDWPDDTKGGRSHDKNDDSGPLRERHKAGRAQGHEDAGRLYQHQHGEDVCPRENDQGSRRKGRILRPQLSPHPRLDAASRQQGRSRRLALAGQEGQEHAHI